MLIGFFFSELGKLNDGRTSLSFPDHLINVKTTGPLCLKPLQLSEYIQMRFHCKLSKRAVKLYPNNLLLNVSDYPHSDDSSARYNFELIWKWVQKPEIVSIEIDSRQAQVLLFEPGSVWSYLYLMRVQELGKIYFGLAPTDELVCNGMNSQIVIDGMI